MCNAAYGRALWRRCAITLVSDTHIADEWSAKASAAELRGLSSIFDCEVAKIRVPLLTLVDYMGYRVTAISLLPISGTKTLRYGSSDAARTVVHNLPDLEQKIEEFWCAM